MAVALKVVARFQAVSRHQDKEASEMSTSEAFKLFLKCVDALADPKNFLEPVQIKQLVAKEADLVKFLSKPSQHPDRVFKAFANISIPRKLWIGLSLNESLDTLNVHFKNLYDHKGQDLYLPLKSGVEKDCLEVFFKFAEQTKLARLEGRELVPLEIFSELVDSISSVKGQLKGLDVMERWLDSMKHRCIPPEDVQKWLDGYKSKVVNMKNMLVDSARIVKQRTATVSEETVLSRFEEGKPADPTENMSPEDAKKWWEEHAKNKDNFKTSSVRVAVRYLTADQDKTAPSKVDKYFKSVKEKNPSYTDAQAWATAWSIYCKYKNPSDPSCRQEEYFKGKSANQEEASHKPSKDNVGDWHQHKILVDLVKNPNKRFLFSDPKMNAEKAEGILRDKFKYTDAEIAHLKQASNWKVAGWSSAIDIMSVLFVEGRKPVPFNIDTIKEINQTFIPVIGDDGEEHEANLNVIGHQYSGPLTYQQEKMGMRRETRVDIQYSVDEGGSPKSSERTAFAALAQLGKRMGFKVEPVHHGYKPQTRKI